MARHGTARRAMLVTALITTTLTLPAMPARGEAPRSAVAELRIPEWTPPASGMRLSAASGPAWWVGDPVPVDDVVMVGATWPGDGERTIQLRTRTGATWTAWNDLEVGDDGPDDDSPEGRRERPATEPVWVGEVDAVQVRATSTGRGAPDVELRGVRIGGGDGLGFQPLEARTSAGAALAATSDPGIIPRGSWDPKGDCAPRESPSYSSDVRFAVVHHTAGSNSYTSDQADDVVRATCLYHRNTRGWNDVGYNFLVDRYGRVYEGRAGGTREAVLGAHVKGFNGGATGVSMMGDFTSVDPPAVMVQAMDRLLAWKLDLHHVDPNGTTKEIAGGGSLWPTGQLVEIPTLFTHGQLNSTGCPGRVRNYVTGTEKAGPRVAPIGGSKLYGGPPAAVEQPVLGVWPVWDVRQRTAGPWDLEITDAAGAVVRTAGGDAGPIDLTWNLADAQGREVAPGRYTATLRSGDALPVTTTFEVLPSTERSGGTDSVGIPLALSRRGYADARLAAGGWAQSDDVVIAPNGSDVAALAAPVATSYNAPLLTSPPDRLPAGVADEVRRLGARTAYVVGDTTELSAQVVTDLKAAGVATVERIAGETRYHTSGRTGWRVTEREGPADVVVVLGEGPDPAAVSADAVIAAGYAAAREIPLLFVRPDELPEPSKWVLQQRDWGRVIVVGGAGVLSDAIVDEAGTAARGTVVRLAGVDRYETSRLVNDELWRQRQGGTTDPHAVVKGQEVVLAPGERSLDAISGAVHADRRGAYFLMVHPSDLGRSPATRAWLQEHAVDLVYGLAAADAARLSDPVLAEVDRILRSAGPNAGDGGSWTPTVPFDDIGGSTHREAIIRLAEAEVTKGCDDRLYCPARSVTRAQMASFIAAALQLAPVDGADFTDVPDGSIHEGNIYALVQAGIAGGYADQTFRPTEQVTRAQMASFLAEALGLEPVAGEGFPDVPPEGTHAGNINALVQANVAGGYADGTYGPLDPVTRAQMASFLARMLDQLEASPS